MPTILQSWAALGVAIVLEVAGSSFLLKSEQFSRLVPSAMTLILYALAFYMLSFALRHIPLGVAYAIWSGVGIVLTAMISVVIFRQSLDMAALVGIGFIMTGVIIMNAFSRAAAH
ncbi:small multidrug resistance pump [Gemmobacter megaterium]|uniref:Small multidrug resistance pump n=1 Tax=Gemmobacter megaterium TaxID=1086013 RepID=A0A1N7LZU1_9RHOB|nr:multidrug efflux SMR transporter [Gemmobacter megaterium]GGE09618.1 QacE family quaternary ammonium compound efflux SMR transporter [Gemmobacter megaterium]SIS79365.1 small multidrug resistance pump [Gemmobacter megaterium]